MVRRRDRLGSLGAWAVYLPILPLAAIQLTMRSRWPGIQNLYNDWANVAYYTVFLFAGFLIACHPTLERLVDRVYVLHQAAIVLPGDDRLRLRGYVGIPLIGRTTTWTRVGRENRHCREAHP